MATPFAEQAMLDRTSCHIWAYGSSAEGFMGSLRPEVKHRVHFTNADVGGTSEAGHVPPIYTIHELMEKNGHEYMFVLPTLPFSNPLKDGK